MFPSISGNFAVTLGRIMKFWLATLFENWYKRKQDGSPTTWAKILFSLGPGLTAPRDLGMDPITVTQSKLIFLSIFVGLCHSKLGFTDHHFDDDDPYNIRIIKMKVLLIALIFLIDADNVSYILISKYIIS